MDKMREDFEAWWEQWFGEPPMSGWEAIWCGEGYNAEDIDHMWDAWQASRKALVVEISPDYGKSEDYSDYHHGWNMRGNAEKENLRAAGVTVKGEGDE